MRGPTCSPLTSARAATSRSPSRSSPASSGRSTIGTCGRAASCRRSAALPRAYNVSRFTVVEAYDRLVAMGYLQSRRGAGFYTLAPMRAGRHPAPSDTHKRNEQLVWLIRRLLEADDNTLLAGGPWLPNSWLDEGRHPPEPQRARAQERRLSARIRTSVRVSAVARASRADRWPGLASPPMRARSC